jgi:periplasmic protein CpxP/Spy
MQEKRKWTVISLAIAAVLVLGQVALAGQYQGPNQDRGGRRAMDPDARLERLSKELKLTDEQKTQLKPILEDQQKQFQALRDDNTLTREKRRSKLQEIRQSTQEQMNSVLTSDQQAKLKKMYEIRRSRWDRRGGGGQN